MREPNARERLTEEDLRAAGWRRLFAPLPGLGEWFHPEVRDGELMAFADAARAEKVRRKADGGG